jgi:hypothetical protein
MSDADNILPEVAKYLKSFPPKRSDWPSDRYYPSYRLMHCFQCGFDTDHYLEGILCHQTKIVRDKRKWPVVYMCDLCKQKQFFKYSPYRNPKFVPMKYRFSGEAIVYSEPREYPMFNCFMQTRVFVYNLLKTKKTTPILSRKKTGSN